MTDIRRLALSPTDRHVLTVALMIAIEQFDRPWNDYKEMVPLREEYLPKMRALLDRLSE